MSVTVFSTRLRALVLISMALAGVLGRGPARAQEEFPFGFLMTLDTRPQPGTKRMPTLEIGDNGEAVLELWCKTGKGQFSVAGNSVIFMAGPMQDEGCTPDRAAFDDDVVATLGEAGTWKRQGDMVTFTGTKSVRFRINTN